MKITDLFPELAGLAEGEVLYVDTDGVSAKITNAGLDRAISERKCPACSAELVHQIRPGRPTNFKCVGCDFEVGR